MEWQILMAHCSHKYCAASTSPFDTEAVAMFRITVVVLKILHTLTHVCLIET